MDQNELLQIIEKAAREKSTFLDLSRKGITKLPAEIGKLTNLTEFYLNNNHLKSIPAELGKLTSLTRLDLDFNKLKNIPADLGRLTKLNLLYLQENQLTYVPYELVQLKNLRKLWLNDNQLTSIPAELGKLTNLTELNLHNNHLTNIPAELGKLTNLTEFWLSNNQLTSIPAELGKLTNLTGLYLQHNQLTSIPADLGELTNLTGLYLQDNQLTSIPTELGKLKNLTELYLQDNQLTSIPAELGRLTNLAGLYLHDNQLTSIPAELGNLTNLTNLWLYHNQLTSIPSELGKLTNLTGLYLTGNLLTSIPAELAMLTKLTEFTLSGNLLKSIQDVLWKLTMLTDLYLSGNQLTSIPAELSRLTRLNRLDLDFNKLKSIPAELGNLTKLRVLNLDGNKALTSPPPEVVKQGAKAILAYLRGLGEGSKPLFEAKLVLVGEGNVGKTCLREALLGNDFVHGRPTTHGIEVRKVIVDHPKKDEKIVLNMWDFGGQKVYRVTHQFFFSRRGLYLVVWKPREGVEENNVGEWIERVRLRVGKVARVLVVATHCQIGGRIARIDKEGLRRKYGEMICGFHEIDSETGVGIEELRAAIAQVASDLPQMGEEFSIKWNQARDEIMALGEPQIQYAQFGDICAKHGMDETSAKTLATLMHELGHIVYHGEDKGLHDMVILEPEWLTKAISLILEDKPTNEANGELEHARLREIWLEHKLEGVERYDPHFHPYFLRLMEKFDVSYRLEDCERSLVGQLVPDERPNGLSWTAGHPVDEKEAGLSLVCQMGQDPPGLVPWLIVRTHRYSAGKHWQGGMFLDGKEHGTAFIELMDRELRLDVRGIYPAHLMSLLSDSVTCLIEQRWPGLEHNLAVPCVHMDQESEPCKGRFELDALRQFKAEGDVTIRCQKCREKQAIDKLLVGFEPSDMDLHEQLDKALRLLEEAKTERKAYASQAAEISRRILKALATETRECPRFFSLLPVKSKKLDMGLETHILTLWCEHPGGEHPVCRIGSDGEGEYVIKQAKKWLVKIAPYASLIARTLKTVVPIGGAAVKAAVDETLLKDVSAKLDLMEKTVSTLLEGKIDAERRIDEPNRLVSRAEGEGLRQLRKVLKEHDKSQNWGGLQSVQTQAGDYLWICREHYRQYDPGLPKL